MSEVTRILARIESGDGHASDELLPLVYGELRKLAAARLRDEPKGQTLQATALVHEAYLRLADVDEPPSWHGRGHFFAAAAEAMRRIVVEHARARSRAKRGGGMTRVQLDVKDAKAPGVIDCAQVLTLHEALDELERNDPTAAQLVKLRYFAGMSMKEAREVLGLDRGRADRLWALARAWLYKNIRGDD